MKQIVTRLFLTLPIVWLVVWRLRAGAGCLLSIGLTYVLVNLLTDVVYRWVNPRMRD